MVEARVTRLCGCGCGMDIKPRTPRKLQKDLEKSLSGKLFLNNSHFGRWSYRHKIVMELKQGSPQEGMTTEELWESLESISTILKQRKEEASELPMGNLLDLIQDTESIPLGGHSAPTNSSFKEKRMTQQGQDERLAKIAALKAETAKLESEVTGTPPDKMPLKEATAQKLGNNTTGGRSTFDTILYEKYPDNKTVSSCVNHTITVGSTTAWINVLDAQGQEVKQYITETELPICQGENGIWKLENDGHYMQVTDMPGSLYANTHCFCCSTPIPDNIKDANGRPKNWGPNTGQMTQHQLAYRWDRYDGPNAPTHNRSGVPMLKARWFTGNMDEYQEWAMTKHPLGETPKPAPAPSPSPTQAPMDLGQGQVEADLNNDLPPGI